MPVFKSKITPASPSFSDHREDMLALVARLREIEQRAIDTSNKRKPTFDKRGQVPPHERVSRILDPGMPFLRLHTLSNYLTEDPDPDTSIAGANIIAGIGFIAGVRCLVWADDSGIRAGSMTEMTSKTAMSLQDIAKRQKLPIVHMVESGGADLVRFKVENWAEAGAVFRNFAQLSAQGVPSLAVLHGASTAGGAYMPGMSDYVIGVRENGMAALAGAALVKAATGEVVDDRELGGSEMHASTSGLVEYLADDDAHALSMARDVVDRWNWNRRGTPLRRRPYELPRYDADEIAGVVPVDYKVPYDVREVIARVVDGSDFEEFKPRYGAPTVCVQASIMGLSCGIIGNNGPLDPQGATKAAQFFQLMDQSGIPMIFLHNTTGYIVGTESEQAGMIKHGAKMVQAVSNLRVPKISMYIGASFGAGNYGMCGYAYEPDFLFSWPNAKTNVMGGESAAGTMMQVMEASAKRKGKPLDKKELQKRGDAILTHFAREEDAFYNGGRVMSHGMIDPRDTRKVLGFVLETCLEGQGRQLQPNAFGVARL